MGQSTDGILVYGIQLDDEDLPEFMGVFDDFDEYVDDLNGLTGAGYASRSAAREKCPADLTSHCSYEYTMYILGVRGTETTARRGYPKEISTFDVPTDKVHAFMAWCAERGVQGEPKWLLCSMWG